MNKCINRFITRTRNVLSGPGVGVERKILRRFSPELLSLTLQACDGEVSKGARPNGEKHTRHLGWQTNTAKHLFLALSPISLLKYCSVSWKPKETISAQLMRHIWKPCFRSPPHSAFPSPCSAAARAEVISRQCGH